LGSKIAFGHNGDMFQGNVQFLSGFFINKHATSAQRAQQRIQRVHFLIRATQHGRRIDHPVVGAGIDNRAPRQHKRAGDDARVEFGGILLQRGGLRLIPTQIERAGEYQQQTYDY